jgi:putative MFS transporter
VKKPPQIYLGGFFYLLTEFKNGVSSSSISVSRSMTAIKIAGRLECLPITRYQRIIFAVIATAWFFDCIDCAMMTFLLSSIKSEFGLSPAQAGTLASMSFIGMFIGAAASGFLADKFGRSVIFRWSIVIWGIASLLCAVAPSLEALMFFRVLLGIGMAMELPIAQALVCEFVPAKVRGKYIAFMEGTWPLGFMCAGLLAYTILPVYGWRALFVVEAIPCLFVLAIRRLVPESPRWLAGAGRLEEAEAVMSEIERRVKLELKIDQLPAPQVVSLGSSLDSVIDKNKIPILNLFQGLFQGKYAKRTIMAWSLWFFALLGYYGLTTWLGILMEAKGYSIAKSTEYIIIISSAGIPGFATAAYLLDRWGRKPTTVLFLLGGGISAYLYGNAPNQTLMIAFGLMMQFFMFGMWSAIYAYTPELFPTSVRATAAGLASAVGRVGAMLGPFLVGLLLPVSGQFGAFVLLAGSLVLAAAAVAVLGDETKGKILEEI